MRQYELMLVLKPQLDEEAIDAVLARVEEILTKQDGQVTNINKWGKRRLAYEISDLTEGFYVVVNFTSTPAAAAELERVLKIADEPLRFLLIRENEE